METLGIAGLVGLGFFAIGIICGKGESRDIESLAAKVPESWLESERQLTRSLREELEHVKRSCRLHHQPPFLGCGGCHPVTRYYGQTVEDQKLADMLAKAKTTAMQLVKDLTA